MVPPIEQFQYEMRIKHLILSCNIDYLMKMFSIKNNALDFLKSLYFLLSHDNFFLLEEKLPLKIYELVNKIAMLYSGDKQIRFLRKEIYWILKKTVIQKDSQEEIQRMIIKEQKDRKIPERIRLDKKILVEMYQKDFENYAVMFYSHAVSENIRMFYFLTTINKFYTYYKDDVLLHDRIIFIAMSNHFQEIKGNKVLEEYYNDTKERIFEHRKTKILVFPKK